MLNIEHLTKFWLLVNNKIFYWPFHGGTSFVDLLCFCSVLCLLCFVRVCLYVLCGHLLGKGWPLGSRLWCLLWVCHFPIGILGQVWYLIVSIPDLCTLTYFFKSISKLFCHFWQNITDSFLECIGKQERIMFKKLLSHRLWPGNATITHSRPTHSKLNAEPQQAMGGT